MPKELSPLPATAIIFGTNNFDSIEVLSYEMGYRHSFSDNLLLDIALFYNEYEGARGYAPIVDQTLPFNVPLILTNKNGGDGKYETISFPLNETCHK